MDSSIYRRLPVLSAIGVVILISLWMLSGLGSEPAATNPSRNLNAGSSELPMVRVRAVQAADITREVLISGRTEPNRVVQLKAEAEGRVVAIETDRGEAIEQGGAILRLDLRDREARLREARALARQREIEFKAMQNLRGQQFTSESELAQAEAAQESARAAVQRIELEIGYTSLTAPFAGIVQDRAVEIGDFVRIGDSVAELVDLDPLIISGEVNEREIGHIRPGSTGSAILSDGSSLQGRVRYLSRVADPATRTFKVELAVPNPGFQLRAGMTAELKLLADQVRVHTISSALLSLADDGTVGVKVVDGQDRVRFYPVEIIGSTQEGLHVSGLPDAIRIITVGQGFVVEGQQVRPVEMSIQESGTSL